MNIQMNEPHGIGICDKKALNHKKKSWNWINIYVLLFKAMVIMASCCFFIHMNVKEFKQKFYLMKF